MTRVLVKRLLATSLILLGGCDPAGSDNFVVGQLESDRVELAAEVTEPITEWLVTEGEPVQAGQHLVQQDTSRIETSITQTEALLAQNQARLDELIRGPRVEQVTAARANLNGALRELEFRKIEFERAERLLKRDLASNEDRDRANAALDAAESNLELQKARLQELLNGTTAEELTQAEQALQQVAAQLVSLQIDLQRHTVVAPADGIVDSILFLPGERPGVGQPVVVFLTGEQPYARAYIPERLRASVSSGTTALLHVDGRSGTLEGEVRWVASNAAFTPYFALTERDRGHLTFLAKIDLAVDGDRLPDGVPVEVEFPDIGSGD